MKKILVTGGAGYIGSILVRDLLYGGFKVTVIDNFRYSQNSLAHLCSRPALEIINGDVRNDTLMSSLLKSHDIIIPLAALVGAPLCDKNPWEATQVNKEAPVSMLKKLSKDQCILMPTTNSAYGTSKEICTEESPLNPISLYAKDKVELEKQLMEFPNAVSLRLATVFGMSPRMRLDLLVNDLTYRAFNERAIVLFESHFIRNYIHVRDVARAFAFCIGNFYSVKGQILNVGLSKANISKLDLCLLIKKFIPDLTLLEAPYGEDKDKRNYIVSNEKFEKLGFKPLYDLSSGIKELIKGYSMIKNSRYSNI